MAFQSTLPVRERLLTACIVAADWHISIHAPREGATHKLHSSMIVRLFQSTLPVRERRTSCTQV